MAAFQPKFVDLVRNYSTTVGTDDFVLGSAVNGYADFATALEPGETFYYSAIGVDNPAETEVGRGTLTAPAKISRDPISGTKTNFSSGTKSIALIAAADWFAGINASAGVGNRSAMAALTRTDAAVLLTEAGREGHFVFDPANHSAEVAADPNQGIYVAPASDPTGASGAWVRKFDGPPWVTWFGAVADCTDYGVGTDNSQAIQAAINFLSGTGGWLHVPAGRYRCSSQLVIKSALKLVGTTTLQDGTVGSHPLAEKGSSLIFDAGVAGIRFSYVADTDTVSTATNPGSTGSVMDGFRIFSASQGAEATGKYGLDIRTTIKVSNVFVSGFGDTNVIVQASLEGSGGSDGVVYGNASNTILEQVHSTSSAGDGFVIAGADANFCKLIACNSQANTGWGYTDNSLIGTTYDTCVSASIAGQYRVLPVATPCTYIQCDDEGGTSSLGAQCTVLGGTLSQRDHGQRLNVFGRLDAWTGAEIHNGNSLTIASASDANNATLAHDGTNLRLTGAFRVVGASTMRAIVPDTDNTYTTGSATARWGTVYSYAIDAKTSVLCSGQGGIGYQTGVGGTVTQATSKTTSVTLNKVCGEITMNAAALAAGGVATFVLTNSSIAAGDNLILNHLATGTFGAYALNGRCAAGSATIDVRNISAAALSEAIVLRFTVIKSVTA